MRPQLFAASLVVCIMVLASVWVPAQVAAPRIDPEINKPFKNPDVKESVKRFETESREVYAQRDAIVKALHLKPGMAVADVGAGTGLFTRLMAEKVGTAGRVYAVDIAPAFLDYIAAESKKRGQPQVRTIRGDQHTTGLAEASIDVAFICDVYHHLEHPAETLQSIHRALRPGGRLAIVDFDRVPGKSSEFVMKHIRDGKAVFLREIQAAGFRLDESPDAPTLRENFFAQFTKDAAAPVNPSPQQPDSGGR